MKTAKRCLSVLLSLCLALGLIPGTALAASDNLPFTDVNTTDWYHDAVQYVYDKGMMSGTSATSFAPNETTSRGMIVTVLHRMEGTPVASGAVFMDVSSSQWYANAVAWASANNIAMAAACLDPAILSHVSRCRRSCTAIRSIKGTRSAPLVVWPLSLMPHRPVPMRLMP